MPMHLNKTVSLRARNMCCAYLIDLQNKKIKSVTVVGGIYGVFGLILL